MKIRNKIIMCFIIAAAILYADTSAVTGYAKDSGDFVIKNGILTDYVGEESNVTIPSDVTEIGAGAFRDNKSLTEVTIPGNVKTIGLYAFIRCNNLKKVTIKNGVETIESWAFSEDNNLTSVTIPKTVARIKDGNFQDSQWLKNDKREFMIEGNGILIHYNGNSSKVIVPSSVKGIGSDAFHSLSNNLTQIVMKPGLKKISAYAFSGFTKLSSVSIPSSVNFIGQDAFKDTPWLKNNKKEFIVAGNGILIKYQGSKTKAVFPSSIRSINESVFENNKKLTEVVLNNKLTEIKDTAFYRCHKLKKINIPSSVKTIGEYVFAETQITSINIPSNLKALGSHTFYNCKKLSEVSFAKDSKITVIAAETFSGCNSLKKVTLPSKLTELGSEAFFDCSNLQAVKLPSTLTNLVSGAFMSCTSLTSIVIPDKITTITVCLFDGCSSLKSVKMSDKVTLIGASAFNNCGKLSDFVLPSNVNRIEQFAFCNCTSLKNIVINASIKELPTKCFDGCSNLSNIELKNKQVEIASNALTGTKWLSSYPGDFFIMNKKLITYKGKGGSVSIPDTVDTIISEAFCNNSDITEVILPSGINNIEASAFYGCSKLKKVVMPETLAFIGDNSFASCSVLEEVTTDGMDSKNNNPAILSEFAFFDCTNLKKVTLPDNITDIENNVFFNCSSLSDIKLSAKLKRLGDFAFDGCGSLTNVSFDGTLENLGNSVFATTPYYTQSKDKMLMLQNVLLKYNGNDTSVTLPDTVTIIADGAFYNNSNLEEITLPAALKSIGAQAFGACKNLKKIAFPATKLSLGIGAFSETSWLSHQKDSFVTLPGGVLIKYQGTDSVVTIPDTITEIAPGAFQDSTLDKIVIPKSVKKIGAFAFEYSSVKEVYLEDGVKVIGDHAFEECRDLNLIQIPDSVTLIGRGLVSCEEENLHYIIECNKDSAAYDYGVSYEARIRVR